MKNNNYAAKTNKQCRAVLATACLIVGTLTLPAEETSRAKGYLTFDAGMAMQQEIQIHETGAGKGSFDPGFRCDFLMGGHGESWGAEFDVGLIYNSMRPVAFFDSSGSAGLDMYQIPLILSVTYRLPLHGPLHVYGGFGIGGVYGIYSGTGTSILGFASDFTFGYQGSLGLNYSITEKCDLGVAYKFLGTTDHDMGRFGTDGSLTHSLLATLTFRF